MSEDNQAVPVEEGEATITEVAQVAPELQEAEVVEVKETLEAKVERITLERDTAIADKEKTQKGLVKVKHKERSKAERIREELELTKAKLNEYTGTQAPQQAQPTEQELHRMAEYKVRCDDLVKDEEFLKLHNERAQNSTNPFIENRMIDGVFAQRGVNPAIAKYILTDDDLCDRLGDAEDPFAIIALVEIAKERTKSKKADVPVKVIKPVNAPKATPTQKTNNSANSQTSKPQTTAEWYAQKNAKSKR